MKKHGAMFLALSLTWVLLAGCNTPPANSPPETTPAISPSRTPQNAAPSETPQHTAAAEKANALSIAAFAYLEYIDASLPDRDCIGGADYAQAQQWIIEELKKAGYSESDIRVNDFTFEEDSTAQNISVTKKGTGNRQIIIGAHYDGTGTGDNGSGAALVLAAATRFAKADTDCSLTFVFFSAEEYGLWGSADYAASMTPEEISRTQYMINIDSIIAGDYCYLYGGVADSDHKTVTQTEAYDNALKTAALLGLDFRSNPWTYDHPEPSAKNGIPAYPSPSTGDWGDHAAFAAVHIPYVCFEATNWEIGDYDGYEETESFGPVMNTDNDSLDNIERLFPGRARQHMDTFAALLEALLQQPDPAF